ncbi:PilZ domain-containing protein [Actinoplanes sp. NPDC049316]|uniref:PilZ domain-containing protein n=1 Tax=Actinoplanes sp. NPDC049316 TaxID=3154727 RepID=UPI0034165EA7
MVTVPAGSTLVLRCPGEPPLTLIVPAEVGAEFVAELPPIPVLGPDDPGTRRSGILELVSSAGVTWVEADLRGGVLTITGPPPTDVVQRRGAVRRPGMYAATGTAELDSEPGRRLVAVSGHVEDVSTSGLLLRATPADSLHLPPGIVRTLLHISMPWGDMTATVATVDQRADQLRGTYEWMDPADEAALRAFCSAR